jgi:small-conductance mechanosensitive channel
VATRIERGNGDAVCEVGIPWTHPLESKLMNNIIYIVGLVVVVLVVLGFFGLR